MQKNLQKYELFYCQQMFIEPHYMLCLQYHQRVLCWAMCSVCTGMRRPPTLE